MTVNRRITAAVVAAAACAVSLAGCGAGSDGAAGAQGQAGARKAEPKRAPQAVRLIGDGSTAYTGAQPNLAKPERLAPGQRPPQFVVFSWDGAGEDGQRLFSHFRKVAKENNATMTYFLSGVYMLPEEKRSLYQPPGRAAGASDIGFNDVEGVTATVEQLRQAWLEGNEIGTHFNGHFCGSGGVGDWSVEQWKSEIAQAKSFVQTWKTNTGLQNAQPLPFDYEKELIGGRTPCLEGRQNFRVAARELGFRYDTSGVREQVWPEHKDGLWDLSMHMVPVPGRSFETISMDYNFMVNQSGTSTRGNPAMRELWGDQMRDGLLAGFRRSYEGNRAPVIIGNHFESWNGGVYMRAVEEVVKEVCTKPEVRCVSFRQLTDWLDAQDPQVLTKLRTLGIGQAPREGWQRFTASPAAAPAAPAGR
ncbi:hypothetical protein [Streptomyces sp. NPDC002640]